MIAMIAALALPLAAMLVCVAVPAWLRRAVTVAGALATAAAVGATVRAVAAGPVDVALGGWAPPVGIALRADGLSAVFLALTAAAMAAVLLPAPGRESPRAAFGFAPLAFALWAALNAVFVSRDLFNLYVGLELMTLAAVGLVALSGRAEALAAALRYLLVALAGSLVYLAGVVLVYAAHGVLDLSLVSARAPAATDGAALALMTAGLMVKAALFPFHVWLPPAHAAAPARASALLSAVVPKAAVLIVWRLWVEGFAGAATPAALTLLGLMGAAAVVWGGLAALVQVRAKLVVAYSTVAQIGYLFVALPLVPLAAGAGSGLVLLALGHGLAKAAAFLAVGQWMQAAGSDRIDALGGLARAMPMSVFAVSLAVVTLAGLPPSAGFTGKWLVMRAAFEAGQPGWAAVMLAGGLLAAAYLSRLVAAVFAPAPGGPAPQAAPVSRAAQAVPLVLALTSVGLGLVSAAPLALLPEAQP